MNWFDVSISMIRENIIYFIRLNNLRFSYSSRHFSWKKILTWKNNLTWKKNFFLKIGIIVKIAEKPRKNHKMKKKKKIQFNYLQCIWFQPTDGKQLFNLWLHWIYKKKQFHCPWHRAPKRHSTFWRFNCICTWKRGYPKSFS